MDKETRQKVLELVHARPRAVAEIAASINKNWRTANRYIEQLAAEDLLNIHVFRKGGRGSLKIAFWPTEATTSPSSVKQFLFQRIVQGVQFEDFSPLDIVQHIAPEYRSLFSLSKTSYAEKPNVDDWFKVWKEASSSLQFFSGNLSFMHLGGTENVLKLLDGALGKGVDAYFLTRVDHTNKELIQKMLSLNKRGHKGKVHIRYAHQPLRCTIADKHTAHLKEDFSRYSVEDTKKNVCLYTLTDEAWVQWLDDVFWHFWHGGVDAEKRLDLFQELQER
tara:strand:- start:350 stop:1180 length:831 start_codon:yes stop_codon:yes gene_type:complete